MNTPIMTPNPPSVHVNGRVCSFTQYFKDRVYAPVGDVGKNMSCVSWGQEMDPITEIPTDTSISPCIDCQHIVKYKAEIILYSQADDKHSRGPNSTNNGVICGFGLPDNIQNITDDYLPWEELAYAIVKPVFLKNGTQLNCPKNPENNR